MKPSKLLVLLLSLTLGGLAYASDNDSDKQISPIEHPGKQMFESNCLTCHAHHGKKHGKEHGQRKAPPIFAVKKHYMESYPERKDFIKQVSQWAKNPRADKAKLVHAVEKFGLMPAQDLKKKELRDIAAYIYDTEFKKGGCCKHKNKAGKKEGKQCKSSQDGKEHKGCCGDGGCCSKGGDKGKGQCKSEGSQGSS